MSLNNLVRTGQLETHETNAGQVLQLLESSQRFLADAKVQSISSETRFDAAYKAVMQCAMVALWANGFRPLKSTPGHHQTMLQTLGVSIGLETEDMQLLDMFRVKRNAIDYTGEPVDEVSVEECIAACEQLMRVLQDWLAAHRPDLLGSGDAPDG
ncbi:MAG: DNA-binding protein [Gammaproteobacteria bacterium]|nr:DNA-binding protein [Gammaproteobacteria bacterium]